MVRNNLGAGLIQNPYDIALYIKDILILCPVIVKPISVRLFIVQENDSVTALGLAQQDAVHDMILGCRPIYRFAGADSIRVVSIADTVTATRSCGQPPTTLPGKGAASHLERVLPISLLVLVMTNNFRALPRYGGKALLLFLVIKLMIFFLFFLFFYHPL